MKSKIKTIKAVLKNASVIFLVMIFSLLLISTADSYCQSGKPNFSGTWNINMEKSNLGQPPAGGPGGGQGQRMGGFGAGNFVAKQEANILTVERQRPGQGGEMTTITSKYTLDGKESVNNTGRGNSTSVATWSADGKTLNIVTTSTFDMGGQSRTTKSTEVWSLSDAKTLSVKTTSTTPNGERVTTMVYNKQ